MNWYDYPEYYDIAFGWDIAPEIEFLERVFRAHAGRPVGSIFEPFCGTGRLAIPLAQRGFKVSGRDLNPRAIAFARKRCDAAGVTLDLAVGDACDWTPSQPVDAVVTLIDSFRHLVGERDAAAGLRAWRRGLRDGGLLVLGLCLGDGGDDPDDGKPWIGEGDGVRVETTIAPVSAAARTPGSALVGYRLLVTERDGRSFEITGADEMRTHTWASLVADAARHGPFVPVALYGLAKLSDPIALDTPGMQPCGNHVVVFRAV